MRKEQKKIKPIVVVLLALLLVAVLIVVGFFILRAVGKSRLSPAIIDVNSVIVNKDNIVSYDEGKTIDYKGKTYVYNENIVPIAFMGIDTMELGSNRNFTSDSGQSDTNMVMAFDTESGAVSMVVIPRDTMVDTDIYNKNGEYGGREKMQLCLSYAYGDGKETSCENTLACMERILCGIEISSYMSLDLSGIGSLNDAVGGIELVSLETIADFKEGEELHLWGESARKYVQRRDTTKFNSDALRRERQLQYAKAFASKALSAAKSDLSVIGELYDVSKKYTCTNLDASTITYLGTTVVTKGNINFDNIYVLEGEAVMGTQFMEVYVDETNVLETVLKVFYKEVN